MPESQTMRWIEDHLYYGRDYCLIWPFFQTRSGYAEIKRDGKNVYVHRFMCQLVHGDPPTPQHQAVHLCHRGRMGCVNPRHLAWKTPSENSRERKPHTLGEYRVGISFNPGGSEMVNKIKRAAADLIDLIVDIEGDNSEVARLKALAMTHVEDAAMWGVKAATKPVAAGPRPPSD